MQSGESKKENFQSALEKVVGCELTDIRLRIFRVEFLFMSEISFLIRMNKKFKFSISGTDERSFDPTSAIRKLPAQDTSFLYLHGLVCEDVSTSRSKLEISFRENAKLWVDLGERDFEAVELLGLSGERHENMDFYYIL